MLCVPETKLPTESHYNQYKCTDAILVRLDYIRPLCKYSCFVLNVTIAIEKSQIRNGQLLKRVCIMPLSIRFHRQLCAFLPPFF